MALLGFAALVLAGCGYSTKEVFPEQYRTVAPLIFENRTFYREIEADLAEALAKQIELRTPYKLASPGTADTILQGTIVGVDQDVSARHRPGAVPEQLEVIVTVNFEWKDLQAGRTIVERSGFSATGRYAPTRPVSEPFELAQHEAVEQLARDIVSTMRGDW